ncbi:MAG: sulfatase-like hydrolase/transferase [Pirellulales bacterium]|nr:sulfatase-like hydrolase/transferase [Pirellulales bacterium]
MRTFSLLGVFLLIGLAILAVDTVNAAQARPNILWLSCEDISPNLGCYGDPLAHTPVLDRLAAQGVRYTHAYTIAGVCAPSRSCVITGMYPTTLGSHHMRCEATLPEHVRCLPEYLRQAGYYCTNNKKTDYNFRVPRKIWDQCNGRAHWRKRPKGKPFFAVFNFGETHESQIRASDKDHAKSTRRLTPEQRQDPAKCNPPAYHPDTPLVRNDWTRYYENITALDYRVGDILKQLKEDGLEEDTIVVFWSDHGVGLPRAKQWLYESGTHVPLIVRIPENFRTDDQAKPDTVDDQLISFIDLAPTMLNLVGLPVPDQMQGRAFLGKDLSPPREYVYGIRDRMDERYDMIRTVRDKRFRYFRNYEPSKTYSQRLDYAEQMPTKKEMRRLYAEGARGEPWTLFFRPTKPREELFDVANDPDEIHDLAGKPEYQDTLKRLREVHLRWANETRDLGLIPELELQRRAKTLGSEYAILHQPGAEDLGARLRRVVDAGQQETPDVAVLTEALNDPDAAVRYWAIDGLSQSKELASSIVPRLRKALKDESITVELAAARGLWRAGHPDEALPVLRTRLDDPSPTVRLVAILVLDEMADEVPEVVKYLKKAVANKEHRYRYVARVATGALERLHAKAKKQ